MDEQDDPTPRIEPLDERAAPSPTRRAAASREKIQEKRQSYRWLWAAATACLALASALPILDAARLSAVAGPCLLATLGGLAAVLSRPLRWRRLAAGSALAAAGVAGCAWAALGGWAHWAPLATADRAEALAEAGRRGGWALAASLGLALFCALPPKPAIVGAAACAGALAGLALGWRLPF